MLAVLITCFNRKDLTKKAIGAIDAAMAGRMPYRVVLVDDGSTDDTSEVIAAAYPDTTIVRGDGTLFWNGGMRRAWQTALEGDADFYMWLNDDTELRPGAIADMLDIYDGARKKETIVVGCTIDPETGAVTYGGYNRVAGSISKLRFRRTQLDETYCDTMNGNCVLIPKSAVSDIGINDEHYRHAFGDNDYGLRAKRAGYDIVQMRTPVARQTRNATQDAKVARLTLSNWRQILLSPKGVPVMEWLYFCRQHGGVIWPVNFVFRYVKMAANGLLTQH